MKKFFLITLLLPVLGFGQTKPKPVKKTPGKTIPRPVKPIVKPVDGFIINGVVKGYPEGTPVALLNGQTGVPESETKLKGNKFVFTGKVATPDFKVILFNNQQPFITLFLDNSSVKVVAKKDSLERASISGSASHDDYNALIASLTPYQQAFAENAPYDSIATANARRVAKEFVTSHPKSYIAPLAIIRYSQLSEDIAETETLFNSLEESVKVSPMANYITQKIAEGKRNAIGTVLADFTQEDSAGKPVSLASYRGKYVLIDFWASWCRPCRQENPNVVDNFNRFKDKNFTVLGVSLDKARDAWINAINADGLTWGHVSDLKGWENAVSQQFSISSIPQNFLIDPDGKIIGKNLRGPALGRTLENLLK